ncbi:TetR/AcrR family transcriptional regulator [Pseudoroseomonas wenyumeiae]
MTTRLIAETAGINEGNLYYHFRTKEALYLALFARFEAAALALFAPGTAAGADPAAVPVERLRRWFLLTWSFRFLFRDAVALSAAAPLLRRRLQRLSLRLQAETRATIAAMEAAGLLALPEEEVREKLLANLWIVSAYWISYLVLHLGLRRVTPAHLRWGYEQVRALLAPYLTEAARARIEALPEMTLPRPLASSAGMSFRPAVHNLSVWHCVMGHHGHCRTIARRSLPSPPR